MTETVSPTRDIDDADEMAAPGVTPVSSTAPSGSTAGKHRARTSIGHARSRSTRPSHSKPSSPTYLIALGVAVAAVPGGLVLTGGAWAGTLAAVGVAVGAVLAGVGTVAAGVRLGMRWNDYRP